MTPHHRTHKPRPQHNHQPNWDDESDDDELINGHAQAGIAMVESNRPASRGLIPHWTPQLLPRPKARQELCDFNALERSAEVFRYSFLSLEHWLSPGGTLREWIRLNIHLALLLAIPALLLGPLVSVTLVQLSQWVTHLTDTTSKLVLFPLTALLIIGLVCALVYLARALPLTMWRQQSRFHARHPHSHPYYED